MPCWYYDKNELRDTPSLRTGISQERERRYRMEGVRFIVAACAKLGLKYKTSATASVFYHRFYMCHSFSQFPRYVTAACCLFLAGKVEETPKKCVDLIRVAQSILTEVQFSTFEEDPRGKIMTLEQILLKTLKFDFEVDHPYDHLIRFAKLLKGDKAKIQTLVQTSWTFINDSFCTTLPLEWEPDILAVSFLYMASVKDKFQIADWHGKPADFQGQWYQCFVDDVTKQLVEDVCHQLLDFYSTPPQEITPVKDRPPAGENVLPMSSHSLSKGRVEAISTDRTEVKTLQRPPPPVDYVAAVTQRSSGQASIPEQCQNYALSISTQCQTFSRTNPYRIGMIYPYSFPNQPV